MLRKFKYKLLKKQKQILWESESMFYEKGNVIFTKKMIHVLFNLIVLITLKTVFIVISQLQCPILFRALRVHRQKSFAVTDFGATP